MDTELRERVIDSWNLCNRDAVVEDLYTRLFAAHPSLDALFIGSNSTLKQKFLDTMDVIVSQLSAGQPEKSHLHAGLRALGEQHSGYGVHARHYQFVEDALLDALAADLGSRFCDTTRQAWQQAYRQVAEAMLTSPSVTR